MAKLQCDVAILGAGTAGLAAERSARKAGAKTLLVDPHFAGTTCASVGCMPSKLLIAAAQAAHHVRQSGTFGIEVPPPVVNGAAVMKRVQALRDEFTAGARRSITELPAGITVKGRARFTSRTSLAIASEGDDGNGVTSIEAKAVVIATGSTPRVPDTFDAVRAHVLTNESIFELRDLPRSVAVIGAGPEGLEIAQALVRLGVEVRLFDEAPTLKVTKDEAVGKRLAEILREELSLELGVKVSAANAEGGVRLSWTGASSGEHLFEKVFVAVGRPPALGGLDLTNADLALDERGTPRFDDHTMQCGDSSVFLAGDVDRDRAVLHEASCEGTIAGRNAASYPEVKPGFRFAPMAIVFTDPSVCVVGRIPGAKQAHVVGKASYDEQGRARAYARNAGLVHLYADAEKGRLLGASLVGPAAEHTAHLLAWAIQRGATATEVLDLPFYHPTYEEGLKGALRAICESVHSESPLDRDDGALPGS